MSPRKPQFAFVVLSLVCATPACQERSRSPRTQPAEPARAKPTQPIPASQPTSQPTTAPAVVQEIESKPARPRTPKRPVDSWVIFREAFDRDADADWAIAWTGGNRLEIRTENVQRLTIDMALLPDGAPGRGPWNVQIDGQGIEITGFTPKPGYTGKKRDLVRSQNGDWQVDRKKLYRVGE